MYDSQRMISTFVFVLDSLYLVIRFLVVISVDMKLWKYSGTLLTATGVIHTIYALFLGKEAFTEMLNNGLIDSIGENHNLVFAFWFLICVIILILWGETLQYYIRKARNRILVRLCNRLW